MDFDADGRIDLISGSYMGELVSMTPGYIYLLRGKSRGRFSWREIILNRDGEPLQMEQVRQRPFATDPHLVDWDADGDLDILVGSKDGEVGLFINEGTRRKSAYATEEIILKTAGRDIRVPGGLAGPVTADWDSDGKVDLLVSAGDGSVIFFRNIGTETEKVLDEGQFIIPPARWRVQVLRVDEEPVPGPYSRIHVCDYNGDGKLDLLLGDKVRIKRELPGLTADEEASFEEARENYMAIQRSGVRAEYRLDMAYYRGPVSADYELELRNEINDLRHIEGDLSWELGRYCETTLVTGFVWVYLRR